MTSKFIFMPRFDRAVKKLKKRYRHITDDLEIALEGLEQTPESGDVIPNDYQVRKLRVASKDMQRGKSGGFRLLYKLASDTEGIVLIYLLLVYVKSDQDNVTLEELSDLIHDLPASEDHSDDIEVE